MKKKIFVIILSVIVLAAIIVGGQMYTVRVVNVKFENKTGLADESGILAATGLSGRINIFNIKESELKKKIAAAYPDNSIVVTDIEREFPNKVTITVKERIPIFRLKVHNPEGLEKYVPTDKDFQRGTILAPEDIHMQLINVSGFEVIESFDIKECVTLRTFVTTIMAEGVGEEALPYLFSEINFHNNFLTVTWRATGEAFVISEFYLVNQTKAQYKSYIDKDYISHFPSK